VRLYPWRTQLKCCSHSFTHSLAHSPWYSLWYSHSVVVEVWGGEWVPRLSRSTCRWVRWRMGAYYWTCECTWVMRWRDAALLTHTLTHTHVHIHTAVTPMDVKVLARVFSRVMVHHRTWRSYIPYCLHRWAWCTAYTHTHTHTHTHIQ
jgi:hypothetical protein